MTSQAKRRVIEVLSAKFLSKLKKLALGIFLAITALIAYLNFDELFYSEYWLHNKIESYSCIEPLLNTQEGTVQLKYNFLKDDEVDVEVIVNDLGYVFLSTGKWDPNSIAKKSFNFKINPETTQKIIRDFQSHYPIPEYHSTEDHLNSLYYILELVNYSTEEEYEIGYYNYMPDDVFLGLTSEIVALGNEVLEEFI